MHNKPNTLLDVLNQKAYFETEDKVVKAVDGIDQQFFRSEVLGLVGETYLVGEPGNHHRPFML